jgi:hypothetical protein
MTMNTAQGVEWGGGRDEPERDKRGWPILRAAGPCDGINPMTGRSCVRKDHRGYHQDLAGAQWLDDE